MEVTIEKADINCLEARQLIDELSVELQTITGSSGQGSFDDADMLKPRSFFVIAREDINHGYDIVDNYGKYAGMPEAICFEKKLN